MRSFTTLMLVVMVALAGINYGLSAVALIHGNYPQHWLVYDLLTTPLALALNYYCWWIWHADDQTD